MNRMMEAVGSISLKIFSPFEKIGGIAGLVKKNFMMTWCEISANRDVPITPKPFRATDLYIPIFPTSCLQ